ncbi:DUF2341 domain-containing protein [Methanococcus voltae]|uniref:DUF2341 domain-containing protein n=1 Tax=Methanococcus voltae (strain ATCC BAA-1334 / A3) TaxID=456320 RepID=D7DUQ9_METV3|nr:DUF2341 domain-containing protein [Methanococcus voltae]MCS3900671.1 hypothetical protein [Methanococcus voltae]
MYLSHSTTTLVLLIMLFGVISFTMLDTYKNSALEEANADTLGLKADSLEILVSNSLPKVFNKVLNDAEFQVINDYNSGSSTPFFDNTDSVLYYLENHTESEIQNDINAIKTTYENAGYELNYNFEITNISMVNGFTFNVDYTLDYNLSKAGALRSKSYENSKNITVKTIISAFHYVKSDTKDSIYIKNPNTENLENFPVLIVLNNSNYNFIKNSDGNGLDFYHNGVKLNYWVEYWNSSEPNPKAFVWLKMNLSANSVEQVDIYYSGTGVSDGKSVFTMFDGFENSDDTLFKKYIHINNNQWDYESSTSPFSNSLYNINMTYSMADNQPPKMITYTELNSLVPDDLFHPVQGKLYIAEVDLMGKEDGYTAPQMLMGYYGRYHDGNDIVIFNTAELGGRWGIYNYWSITNNLADFLYSNGHMNDLKLGWEYENLWDEGGLLERIEYVKSGTYHEYTTYDDQWYRIKLVLDHKTEYTSFYLNTLNNYISQNGEVPLQFSAYPKIFQFSVNNDVKKALNAEGSYFVLGSSNGDNDNNPELHYDNFRVRKYANPEPYVSGWTLGNNLVYISPPSYSESYELGGSNAVFVENPTSPSIVDMLTGINNSDWGYGITIASYL